MLDRHLTIRSLAILACASVAHAQSERAYAALTELSTVNQRGFYVYKDLDSGENKGFPSGLFGDDPNRLRIALDAGCVDDPNNRTLGCATDPLKFDCTRGTVLRLTWDRLLSGQYAGLNIEEPENYGARTGNTRYNGYNLFPATQLVFSYRSPTGIRVKFGVNKSESEFMTLTASTGWAVKRIPLDSLRPILTSLTNVQILFSVVTSTDEAPNGGTLLLDDIRFEPALQATSLSFPLANKTCGIIPVTSQQPGYAKIPPDQIIRNLTTTYESALTLWAFLQRGTPNDLLLARSIADAFVYAADNDNGGLPNPKAADGSTGWRNAYLSGNLKLFNDQDFAGAQGVVGAKAGQVRLAGFGASKSLCGPSGFCLVLDGSTGGNNAFGIIAMLAAYRHLGDVRYLNTARKVANWIHEKLFDSTVDSFGGYRVGYLDEGATDKANHPILGKSVENNADIAAAFQILADVESEFCNRAQAEIWASRSRLAGDFVMRMFDKTTGRFFAGTAPDNLAPQPGIIPDGEHRGKEVINRFDFLDANTFVPLAMAELPRYRTLIDWRRPIQWALDHQAQAITSDNRQYRGFSLIDRPAAGPNGIAWEFTGQMVESMRLVDRLYGETRFKATADLYQAQIVSAQSFARFGDGQGLVAATLESGESIAPYDQCLNTPFQCIASRVGLAATLWAIFAERDLNPLGPRAANVKGQPLLVNAASFAGCVAPGGLFSLFGVGLAAPPAAVTDFPLPRTLSGFSLSLNNVAAPLLFAAPSQANGQVPWETPAGTATAALTVSGGAVAPFTIRTGATAPGFFTDSAGRCIAFHYSGTRNTPETPLLPGDGLTLFLTGAGPVDTPMSTGLPASSSALVRIAGTASAMIGGQPARIGFLGLTPGTVGVAQANLEPAAALPPGEHDVALTIDRVPSNTCRVSIAPPTNFPALAVTAISPAAGPSVGGTRVVLQGSGFHLSGMTVRFGAIPANEVLFLDANTLVAFAPAGEGTVDVSVTNPSGRTVIVLRAFTYRFPAPLISGVSPSAGPSPGGTVVKIEGIHFRNPVTVRFGSSLATLPNVGDSRPIQAIAPPGTGNVSITLTNPDGQSSTMPAAFTYIQANPSITGRVQGCRISGSVGGIDAPAGYRVVVYAQTGLFYVQPCDNEPKQTIAADYTWGPIDSHSGGIYALLVRNDYIAPITLTELPAPDGRLVLARTGLIGTLIGCDVARCTAQ